MSTPEKDPAAELPERLTALDVYRGFVMLLMMAEVLKLNSIYRNGFPESDIWAFLGFHQDHVQWIGCSLHDLIQPSFSFLVGAALPFSLARRKEDGETWWVSTLHAFGRALILVLLGVFLRSLGKDTTYWTFEDTLSQIGLGYGFLYLLALAPRVVQWSALGVILVGYWLAFLLYPLPGPDFDWKGAGMSPQPERLEVIASGERAGESIESFIAEQQPIYHKKRRCEPIELADVEIDGAPAQAGQGLQAGQKVVFYLRDAGQLKGMAAHWNKNTNLAWAFDKWFLNLFHRPKNEAFVANSGGYATLSFIPTLATMLLGLLAGQVLRGEWSAREKLTWLLAAGAICLATGWLLGALGICPVVKRIWTPSWVLFSGGWCFFFTAAFYAVTDIGQYKAWAFPLIVIGMNSIAAYVIADGGLVGYLREALPRHFGSDVFNLAGAELRDLTLGLAILACEWLILFYMYRQRIFLRI